MCACAGEASLSSSPLPLMGSDRDDASSLAEAEEQPTVKFMSIILTNLQINYDGWKAELPKEEEEEVVEEEKEDEGQVKDDHDNNDVSQ